MLYFHSMMWVDALFLVPYRRKPKGTTGADPGFQVRGGGGGGALKKIAPSGGRREHFWGISCEKSRFYAKKSYFFLIAEGGAKIFEVYRVKNHDFTTKNLIFFQF